MMTYSLVPFSIGEAVYIVVQEIFNATRKIEYKAGRQVPRSRAQLHLPVSICKESEHIGIKSHFLSGTSAL